MSRKEVSIPRRGAHFSFFINPLPVKKTALPAGSAAMKPLRGAGKRAVGGVNLKTEQSSSPQILGRDLREHGRAGVYVNTI